MVQPFINENDVDRIKALVSKAHRISIVCHVTPDGDAMGSSLCLWHVLKVMHKNVHVITPDAPPSSLSFLPGTADVVIASYGYERARNLLALSDLVFCLDFNELKRVDRMEPILSAASAPKVLVDHHVGQIMDADVKVSHPEMSSTAALLYCLLSQADWLSYVDLNAAECVCTGMMTDTGNFSYNSNDPKIYGILSELIAKGVDKDAIYAKVFNTNSVGRIRLMGYAQYAKMHIFSEHCAALITLSLDELSEFGYSRGDTESLVNVPLSIPGVIYSVFLREDDRGFVKVSMRSKGDFSVKDICSEHFGGGGHVNAAGGEFFGSLSDAVDFVLSIMPEYDKYLKVNI